MVIDPLENRIFFWDQRYGTFRRALTLMQQRHVNTIVETGTARNGSANCAGDGASTLIWGDWARQNGAFVYSVDIDPIAIENAAKACFESKDNVKFYTEDSVKFLQEFDKPIDFLYLDSFDYDENNPIPSQEHHLKEIVAALPKLHKDSIVMIDDCKLKNGGKGKLVIPNLEERGWRIDTEGYQVILVQN